MSLTPYPSIMFWGFVIILLLSIFKIRKMKKDSKIWKLRLIITAMIWGLFWIPITLTWGYYNFAKGTGRALSIGKSGANAYMATKKSIINTTERFLNVFDNCLDQITPTSAKNISSKVGRTISPIIDLSIEVTNDIGIQPFKPHVSVPHKIWRSGVGLLGNAVKGMFGAFNIVSNILK